MVSLDPIKFHSEEEPYKDRLIEAVQTGICQLNGIPLARKIIEEAFDSFMHAPLGLGGYSSVLRALCCSK
ncbi:hypothetical protein DVH24_035242 [Malus domestica]|uniref:Uncharacterized protein n=1 Tax=Malus domestica TaxID=3750 RepID=A0A498J4D8_MALDO|nr:hypothetical protein DVH24_035242 [Malus domestica]